MRSLSRNWYPLGSAILVLLTFLVSAGNLYAYSVLTHEEIVDLAWSSEIRPLLLLRFPSLTEEQITEAHAYAYGGSVIQDLGYYPFGSRQFSDLVHYVRTGDFVIELLRQSQDENEYAFALGALSHYVSDTIGHPAVNAAVALAYPKLRAKFGKSVRYAQDRTAHLKTEFGFDTLQVAKNRYASEQYHAFIGFKVAEPLLELTFPIVYGLQLKQVLPLEDLAIGSYRFSVSRLIPQMTKVALRIHKKEIMQETPNFAKKRFLYRLSRSDYERNWGKTYTKPDFGTRALSLLLRVVPKIGPFKGMGFNNPTAKTEDLYVKSINATVDRYRVLLQEVHADKLVLANCDLDDGNATAAEEYTLADLAYGDLLSKLAAQKFDGVTPELRDNILDFYSGLLLPPARTKVPPDWPTVLNNLDRLKSALPSQVSGQPALISD
jgi:hypothetical protein